MHSNLHFRLPSLFLGVAQMPTNGVESEARLNLEGGRLLSRMQRRVLSANMCVDRYVPGAFECTWRSSIWRLVLLSGVGAPRRLLLRVSPWWISMNLPCGVDGRAEHLYRWDPLPGRPVRHYFPGNCSSALAKSTIPFAQLPHHGLFQASKQLPPSGTEDVLLCGEWCGTSKKSCRRGRATLPHMTAATKKTKLWHREYLERKDLKLLPQLWLRGHALSLSSILHYAATRAPHLPSDWRIW